MKHRISRHSMPPLDLTWGNFNPFQVSPPKHFHFLPKTDPVGFACATTEVSVRPGPSGTPLCVSYLLYLDRSRANMSQHIKPSPTRHDVTGRCLRLAWSRSMGSDHVGGSTQHLPSTTWTQARRLKPTTQTHGGFRSWCYTTLRYCVVALHSTAAGPSSTCGSHT